MKKIYFFLLVLIFPIIGFTQTDTSVPIPDSKLIEAYGEEYINRLKTENPFLIKRWNFYLENAFIITDEVLGKNADYQVVKIDDLKHFNILLIEKNQKIERAWDIPTIYKIENTNKLLVYLSGKEFNEKLKAHLKG